MAIVGIRGATPLTDEVELQAQLATLLRLENVGVMLGAGASVTAGGKTMRSLWSDFVDTSPEEAQWLIDNEFIQPEALAAPDERVVPNVEQLNDSLEIALVEWRRQGSDDVPHLERARAHLTRAVVRAAQLQPAWWQSPGGAESDAVQLQHHRTLLQKLVAARQPGQAAPWVFTTNYDLAVEWSAESIDLQVVDGFLGVHGRRFSPQSFDLGFRNTQARGEARFGVYNVYLAKLHGSLTWREDSGQVYEMQAALAGAGIQSFLDDVTKTELGFMVMPRAAKYMQTVGYVLGELFRRFSEFLSRPQTSLLVCGYGFGDEHINRLLTSALLNPTLQLVVYSPEFSGDALAPELPIALRKLLSLKNPRVTVVGGGAGAYLDKLAAQLPDPLLYDDEMRRLAKALREPLAPEAGAFAPAEDL
ncbi:SIR2 family protein [Burkholderia multivorans]|uniref:SIR2 family anti-phage-associated protein n=1 Tax=Burkholderia multivorans TaxID=87883 RepID=UPI00190741D0|nr:SIR2 family anti-phage-associated protein [Burkholderia multivorans]MBJ9654710.1 SIR2 family protein [Burkholderia multivorans]MBR8048730.1 SIR2 family protein [Burkholderia multivorans]MBU9528743.1 SIR2 family protein [Burkholderia multivorans]MCO1359407.1 SIR2 family protein [Burkholderia multivorans]MCO1419168.1 SIR2 family protein [Burkholderia multivorans]